MASISCLVNAFWEILELKRSLVEGQQLQQKDRKKRKGKREKMTKNEKPKVVGSPGFDFCACLSKKVSKHDYSEKQGRVLRFESCFE